MAWVTVLGPHIEQVEYRLRNDAGCSISPVPAKPGEAKDTQVDYRLDDQLPLEWIGAGLPDVGIEPGTAMTEAQKAWARAIMDGKHPQTGEQLVNPKLAVDPRGKLDAAPLVRAIEARAAAVGKDPADLFSRDDRQRKRYERLVRGVKREGDLHRAPLKDLGRLAMGAGLRLDRIYGAEELATARQYHDKRVRVGNRGYDLTLDIQKSYSVLYALADPELAAELEQDYLHALRETVAAMEKWAAYGMRGHHGDGEHAERVDGRGVLGWVMMHRTARPVDGQAPDPHLHGHVSIANMVLGSDGEWSTIAAGGRDLHRHAHAADALLKARLRQITAEKYGVQWQRNERTGAWEISYIPEDLRDRFSKRGDQVAATLRRFGVDPEAASVAQAKDAAARSREARQAPGPGGDLRTNWRTQTIEAGYNPDELVTASTPGPNPIRPTAPSPAEIAAWIWRDETTASGGRDGVWQFSDEASLTAHRKVVTKADVIASVIDAMPGGVADLAEAERLADEVLAVGGFAVRVPDAGATHLSNHERYTSEDIIAAERTILDAARDGYDAGAATVSPEVAGLAVRIFEATQGFELSGEQRTVLDRLLHAGHRVDAVVGVAGSGKTTLMSALRLAHEADGHVVAGATTAAVAAANLQAEAGIPSTTIAGWMWRVENGRGLRGVDVLVVDEAAMVDDRQMARLVAHAAETGTQIIGIGDPMQLRSPGVGGAFQAVHQLVDGLTLTDNRRQRDEDERRALNLWRDKQRLAALRTWSDAGRVHAVRDADTAYAQMLAYWDQVRAEITDPHERIAQLLLLTGSNSAADRLNTAAQAIRLAAGELESGTGREYVLRGGARLTLHVGDQVMARINDRRGDGSQDILNGTRGVVIDVADNGDVTMQWRTRDRDGGTRIVEQTLPERYVIRGGLQLGYAMTTAKAQGLTAEKTFVYGAGMDAHTLYPAMSRHRGEAHLWLPLDVLETETERVRQGEPRTPEEELRRAITAYARALERSEDDRLVIEELGDVDLTPPAERAARLQQRLDQIRADRERVDAAARARAWRERRH
ncbi:MAG: relaxase domain-containing protein, partial [Thermoactinospora sp.]|nr:relaxase domain-containing protein [Thermoactinospora sp.]